MLIWEERFDITLKVNAKDEKEDINCQRIKKSKGKKVVKEGILNEARQVTKTRFGAVTVSISEEGGSCYNPTLLVDVALDKKPLADINVTGDQEIILMKLREVFP